MALPRLRVSGFLKKCVANRESQFFIHKCLKRLVNRVYRYIDACLYLVLSLYIQIYIYIYKELSRLVACTLDPYKYSGYPKTYSQINKFPKSHSFVGGIPKWRFLMHMAGITDQTSALEMAWGPSYQNIINKKTQCWWHWGDNGG